MKRLCILINLLLIVHFTQAQIMPEELAYEGIQYSIMQNTQEFDSLVLLDYSSYWSDSLQLKGFGFSKNERYKVIIHFKRNDKPKNSYEGLYEIQFSDYKKEKLSNEDSTKLEKIGFDSIRAFAYDLLDYSQYQKARGKKPWPVPSDQSTLSVLIVNNVKKKCFLQSVYNAEAYSKHPFNKEIAGYTSIYFRLWNLYSSSNK